MGRFMQLHGPFFKPTKTAQNTVHLLSPLPSPPLPFHSIPYDSWFGSRDAMLPRSKRSLSKSLLPHLARTTPTISPPLPGIISPIRNPTSRQILAPTARSTRSFTASRNLASSAATSGSGGINSEEVEREVDLINVKFGEAREEIEMAMESKETVYFDEEAQCAREAVREVLERFEGLLRKVGEGDREALRRSMGLKMEQLKAELRQLED